MIYVDLVLDNGGIIRVSAPQEHEDDVYDAIENGIRLGGWLSFKSRWDGADSTFNGLTIDRVNMGRVVATL